MLPIRSMVTQYPEHVLLSVDDILTSPMGGGGKGGIAKGLALPSKEAHFVLIL